VLADSDGVLQSTDAGGEPPMNDASPKSLSSEGAFKAALRHIAASNREPTPWEAGCLYAALCAMAASNYRTAQQKVAWSALGDTAQTPPMLVLPIPTVQELREALANLVQSSQ
jgi:hypothetical protein